MLPFMKHVNGFIFEDDILTTHETVGTSIITNASMCSIATTLRHCNKQVDTTKYAEQNEIPKKTDECQLNTYDNKILNSNRKGILFDTFCIDFIDGLSVILFTHESNKLLDYSIELSKYSVISNNDSFYFKIASFDIFSNTNKNCEISETKDLAYDATDIDLINNNICVGDKIISPSILLPQSQNKIIDLNEPIRRNACNLRDTILWCIKIMKQNSNVKEKSMRIVDDNYVLFDGKNFANNLTLSTWYGGKTSAFSRTCKHFIIN